MLVLLSSATFTKAKTLSCRITLTQTFYKYSSVSYAHYNCEDSSISITNADDDRSISSVSASHQNGYGNSHVEAYIVNGQKLNYLPTNMHSYFTKLRVIYVNNCGLKEINRKELQFPNLKYINLQNNSLEVIESDLFAYNPILRAIELQNNKIKDVKWEAFASLTALTYLYIQNNTCIQGEDEKTGSVDKAQKYAMKIDETCNSLKYALNQCHRQFMPLSSLYAKEFHSRKTCERTMRQSQCQNNAYQFNTMKNELNELRNFRRKMLAFDLLCKVSGSMKETCEVQNMKSFDKESEIDRIKQIDSDDMVTTTISKLKIINQQCAYIPFYLNEKFSQIKNLSIINSGLLQLKHEDFLIFYQLEQLNLKENKLSVVQGDTFDSNMKILEILDLSSNNIEIIEDEAFKNLENLQEIRLNDNLMETIKSNIFGKNLKLKTVQLQNNHLSEISGTLLNQLEAISFADFTNNICLNATLPETKITTEIISKCSSPIAITCHYVFDSKNVYTCNATMDDILDENVYAINFAGKHTEGYGNEDVQQLWIDSQVMNFFPPKVLAKYLPNVSSLTINSSELQKVRKNDFDAFTSLDTLKITKNEIKEIELNAFDNLKLKELDLSHNNLTELPEKIFSKLTKLQILRLDFNDIITLEKDVLPSTKKLKEFSMSNNLLENIDGGVVKYLLNANSIDFTSNVCIDLKFNDAKKLFTELLNC